MSEFQPPDYLVRMYAGQVLSIAKLGPLGKYPPVSRKKKVINFIRWKTARLIDVVADWVRGHARHCDCDYHY